MLAIKNNMMAANAARHLGRSYDALAKSVERLSSGLRINSAQDDAAGLAVRELLRSDVAVKQQGIRNAQDGLSMLQTTEGAMQKIDDLLTRMKQLAEQASTGVYSDTQRGMMDSEFQAIIAEIDRIAGSVDFNGNSLLSATAVAVVVRFGEATDVITVDPANATANGLGVDTLDIATAATAATAFDTVATAIDTAAGYRATFGAQMNVMEGVVELLGIQAESLSSAESRISDVDVATEMAAMTRTQVLAQAGTAMLAQANAMPQMALTLLR
ncbi:MAG: flagellin [Planctomycetes bacterium]|nr:flagellin [Planctomycetota bacterium]